MDLQSPSSTGWPRGSAGLVLGGAGASSGRAGTGPRTRPVGLPRPHVAGWVQRPEEVGVRFCSWANPGLHAGQPASRWKLHAQTGTRGRRPCQPAPPSGGAGGPRAGPRLKAPRVRHARRREARLVPRAPRPTQRAPRRNAEPAQPGVPTYPPQPRDYFPASRDPAGRTDRDPETPSHARQVSQPAGRPRSDAHLSPRACPADPGAAARGRRRAPMTQQQ